MQGSMKEIAGGVCAPRGFRAGGICCGIKASSRKRDLALIYAGQPCAAAALFTANRVKAASVLVTREHLAATGGVLRAVIANSGNANACTGAEGLAAARRMAALAADEFAIRPEEVAVASTGVIGAPLPLPAVEGGIESLAGALRGDEAGHAAALEAIMTTDTRMKGGSWEFDVAGTPVRLGGMVKGSGMIHPNLATMLCFMTTDAVIERDALDAALRRAVEKSFNRVTVDGDTSTNDTILIMASGLAGNERIAAGTPAFDAFAAALERACVGLARAMARDGEGATKLLMAAVTGAVTEDDAAILARAVASSSLVKAACFGADANWGRILCAIGYAPGNFNVDNVDVTLASRAGNVTVCEASFAVAFDEELAKQVLAEDEIQILVNLHDGLAKAEAYGCDLTYEYVRINGMYGT